jgi:hypothetical protein
MEVSSIGVLFGNWRLPKTRKCLHVWFRQPSATEARTFTKFNVEKIEIEEDQTQVAEDNEKSPQPVCTKL